MNVNGDQHAPVSVVELNDISMVYRRGMRGLTAIALDQIQLTISAGETVGFIGNNGAGKSTTMRIILGLQRPSTGIARLNGLPVDNPDARRGVAYVPENPFLYDYLTPLELLTIGRSMHRRDAGTSPAAVRNACMVWLERFGIAHVANKRIRTFSKGMGQRTALAHALCCEPDFLILDEPLSGLDPLGRQEVVSILDEYRASGKTLFFSSHVLNDVERLADRFVFIHKGKIQAVCATTSFLADDSPRFVVMIEGRDGMDGFDQISSRMWQREVCEDELAVVLSDVKTARATKNISLYAVRNMNSLEKAYETFVRSAQQESA